MITTTTATTTTDDTNNNNNNSNNNIINNNDDTNSTIIIQRQQEQQEEENKNKNKLDEQTLKIEEALRANDRVVQLNLKRTLGKLRERVMNDTMRAREDSRKLFSEYDEKNDLYFATDDPMKIMAFRGSDNEQI
jgi:hypothetical protein